MESLVNYLGSPPADTRSPRGSSGKLYKYPDKPAVVLTVFKFSDVTNKIIPFFDKYSILGVKQLDYID